MSLSDLIQQYGNEDKSRLQILRQAAHMSLGVTAFSCLPNIEAKEKVPLHKRQMIHINMDGGMSHIDYWDPKSDQTIMNGTETFTTKTGLKLGKSLKDLDKHIDKIALIRSMSSPEGDHIRGRYLTDTSYRMLGSIKHPSFGSMIHKLRNDKLNPDLPASVSITNNKVSSGFLGSDFDYLKIANPRTGLNNIIPENVKHSYHKNRIKMIIDMSQDFRKRYLNNKVKSHQGFFDEAVTLMNSKSVKAFDLKQEKEHVKRKYGNSLFANGLLLGRRLLQEGVQYVRVDKNGWDYHNNIRASIVPLGNEVAKALAAFFTDMEKLGLLDKVLIVFTTEFGRTPYVSSSRKGRDHHPLAYSQWMAGAGIKGGTVYGKTDEQAYRVIENKVSPMDFNATAAHILGIDLEKEVFSKDNRPFTIARVVS